ncbi:MAG TPA: SHOCT domain-containing protein [Phycisphaerae bacterium]|nr:SHOCT domain-containing protein [Phycisphaerae bacterium]HRW54637.1 SHOCT domain-containing protein [Phycisphaerae bacterium]
MLAKLGAQNSDVGDVIFWCVIFIVAIVVIVAVGMVLRRRLVGDTDIASADSALTLQQLRDLRNSGQISEAEFQTLKSQIIAQFKPTNSDVSD